MIVAYFLAFATRSAEGTTQTEGRIVPHISPSIPIFPCRPGHRCKTFAIEQKTRNSICTTTANIHTSIAIDVPHAQCPEMFRFVPPMLITEIIDTVLTTIKSIARRQMTQNACICSSTHIRLAIAIQIAKHERRIIVIIIPTIDICPSRTTNLFAKWCTSRRKLAYDTVRIAATQISLAITIDIGKSQ